MLQVGFSGQKKRPKNFSVTVFQKSHQYAEMDILKPASLRLISSYEEKGFADRHQ
jgi:hypothetical protein